MSKKPKTHPVDKPKTGINTSGTESTAPATAPLPDQPGLSVGDLKKIVQIVQTGNGHHESGGLRQIR